MRLLLTRPEPDAQRTAAALRAQGHDVIIAPLLRIAPVADAEIGAGPWAAILITSSNAASAVVAHARAAELLALPVFAVGGRSADAMAAAGFADVTSADGNVSDLARLVAARLHPAAPLLYLAGEDRSGDLAGDLRARGFAVETAIIYRAVAASNLPPAAAEALAGGIDGVLHFSRRSAEVFVDAARAAGVLESALQAVHFCLSTRIAEPLARAGAADIRVAERPNEAVLLALIDAA
ncbi:MAG: uroporphyrinogen-III synthase [Xanthobacteraceae bacterium]